MSLSLLLSLFLSRIRYEAFFLGESGCQCFVSLSFLALFAPSPLAFFPSPLAFSFGFLPCSPFGRSPLRLYLVPSLSLPSHPPSSKVEKHHPDGKKQIFFPDNTVKNILPGGEEENTFPDGTVQRLMPNGDKMVSFATGQKVREREILGERAREEKEGPKE